MKTPSQIRDETLKQQVSHFMWRNWPKLMRELNYSVKVHYNNKQHKFNVPITNQSK